MPRALFFVPMLMVLAACVWLASWQFSRYDAAVQSDAIKAQRLGQSPYVLRHASALTPELEYRRLRLLGRFEAQGTQYLWLANAPGGAGWVIASPFRLAGGGALMVERGFLPAIDFDPVGIRPPRLPKQNPQWLDVRLHLAPAVSRFTPTQQNAQGIWYARNPHAMLQQFGLAAPNQLAYFAIALERTPLMGEQLAGLLPPPAFLPTTLAPARHFGYALTWAGLALVLLVASGVYYAGQRKRS